MKTILPLLLLILLVGGCAPAAVSDATLEPDSTFEAPDATGESAAQPTEIPAPTAGPSLEELMATPQTDYLNARLDEAVEAYHNIAVLYPTSAEPLLGLAAISDRMGDFEAADGWVRAAVAADPTSAEAWRQLSILQTAAGDWEAVRETLTELIALVPEPELYRARAITSARLADPEFAVADLTQAAVFEPTRIDGWSRAAGAAAALRDNQTAIAIAEAGLALNPGDVPLLHEHALACYTACEPEAALAAFDALLAAAPDHTGGHFWRGRLLDRMGSLEEALAEAKLAAELGMTSGISDQTMAFEAIADAADLITRSGDVTAAFEYVEGQVFIYGSRDELLLAYARIDWRRDSIQAATDRLAVLTANGYLKANYWAGRIFTEAGDAEAAIAALQAFTAAYTYGPEAEEAYALLAELEG